MNEITILKQALDKVVLKGFRGDEAFDDWYNGRDWDPNTPYKLKPSEYYNVIFNHNFAKLLWGKFDPEDDERFKLKYIDGEESMFMGERWQYHLQLMVLEEKPILYLEQFLKGTS